MISKWKLIGWAWVACVIDWILFFAHGTNPLLTYIYWVWTLIFVAFVIYVGYRVFYAHEHQLEWYSYVVRKCKTCGKFFIQGSSEKPDGEITKEEADRLARAARAEDEQLKRTGIFMEI
jgi:hypothetical protein